jgi:tartrate-resistant acid phosphatase type 5
VFNIPSSSKRFIIIGASFVLVALLVAGVQIFPASLSLWNFNHAAPIEGRFIAPSQQNKHASWATLADEGVILYALGNTAADPAGQAKVSLAMNQAAASDKPSAILLLGDNFYPDGLRELGDSKIISQFTAPYQADHLQVPFYACLGNRDRRGNPRLQLESKIKDPRWHLPYFNYSFTPDSKQAKLVEVFVIDTSTAISAPEQFTKSIALLGNQIETSKARWKIVAGHHPIHSGGEPSPRWSHPREELLAALTSYHVDLYLCSGDHHMEMGAIDKHLAYAIAGTGSALGGKVIQATGSHFAARELGFLKLAFTPEALAASFVNEHGEQIYTEVISK